MKVTQSPKTKPNLKPLRIEWPWVQKNDDDSKIEARIAELVITHKAETELLKKSFKDQILSLIDKTKENKIHIESIVMDFKKLQLGRFFFPRKKLFFSKFNFQFIFIFFESTTASSLT